MTEQDLGRHLPLTAVAFEIMLTLAESERHGYAIMREVEDRTAGQVSLHPGTLYRALARLVDAELLQESGQRSARELGTERRKYYALTPLGRAVAEAEARRLADQLGTAQARNLLHDKSS